MKPVLYVMVGPSYSGKSVEAERIRLGQGAVLLSSDAIRGELYGDESIQRDPEKVFRLLHKRMIENLREGNSVVYDATNLVAKRRKHIIKMVRDAKIDCEFRCVVCVCRVEELTNRFLWSDRERKVPHSVIQKQLRQFQCPFYHEGWDKISIVDTDVNSWEDATNRILAQDKYIIAQIVDGKDAHDNPNHIHSITEHMVRAENYCEYAHPGQSARVKLTARYHDIGKYWTKSFINSKGEHTSTAHYYNHENIGAYIALARFFWWGDTNRIYISSLITYHMEHFKRGEAMSKFLEQFAQYPGFVADLGVIHECDEAAH